MASQPPARPAAIITGRNFSAANQQLANSLAQNPNMNHKGATIEIERGTVTPNRQEDRLCYFDAIQGKGKPMLAKTPVSRVNLNGILIDLQETPPNAKKK